MPVRYSRALHATFWFIFIVEENRPVDIRSVRLYGWRIFWIALRHNSQVFLKLECPGVHPMLLSELLLS